MVAVINADGQRPKKDVLMFIQSGRSMHLVNVPLVTDQSLCYNNTSLSLSTKSSSTFPLSLTIMRLVHDKILQKLKKKVSFASGSTLQMKIQLIFPFVPLLPSFGRFVETVHK